MQCLKCKKKMKTKRTKAGIGEVRRERYCKKCKLITTTLEIPLFKINKEKLNWQERVDKMTDLYEETSNELEKIRESLDAFFVLNIPKKK